METELGASLASDGLANSTGNRPHLIHRAHSKVLSWNTVSDQLMKGLIGIEGKKTERKKLRKKKSLS